MGGGELRTATVEQIAREMPAAGGRILVASEREGACMLDALQAAKGNVFLGRRLVTVVGLQAKVSVCAAYDDVVSKIGVGDVAFQTPAAVARVEAERVAELALLREHLVRDVVAGSIILVQKPEDGFACRDLVQKLRPQDRGKIRIFCAPTAAHVDRVLDGIAAGQIVYRDPVHLAKVDLGAAQWSTWTRHQRDLDGEFVAALPTNRACIVVVASHDRALGLAVRVQQRLGESAALVNFLVAPTRAVEKLSLTSQIMPVFYDPRMPARSDELPAEPAGEERSEAELALAAKKAAEVETGKRRAKLRTGKRRAQRQEMRRFVDGLPDTGVTVVVPSHACAKHIRDVIASRRPRIQRSVTFQLPDAQPYEHHVSVALNSGCRMHIAPGVADFCARRDKRLAKEAAQPAAAVAVGPAPEDAYLAHAADYAVGGGYIGLRRAQPPKPTPSRPLFAPVPKPGELGQKPVWKVGSGQTVPVSLGDLAKRIEAIRPTVGIPAIARLSSTTIPGKPPMGWVCPRCDAVLAPHVASCTCKAGSAS